MLGQLWSKPSIEIVDATEVAGFKKIIVKGYAFAEPKADMLEQAYEKIKDEPGIIIDLTQVDVLNSVGVSAVSVIVSLSRLSANHQKMYIIALEKHKKKYLDVMLDEPRDIVFVSEQDIPKA